MNESPETDRGVSSPGQSSAIDALSLARIYLRSGCLDDALRCLNSAAVSCVADRSESTLLMAEALRLSGRNEEAIAKRSEIGTLSTPALLADLRLLDARLLQGTGQYQECIDRFSIPLDQPAAFIADILVQTAVAECLARKKDLGLSRSTLEWTIAQSDRMAWPEGVASGLMALALLDHIEGHWSRAENLLLEARDSYRSLGHSRNYIKATVNLGVLRLWRGHLTFADESLREGVRLAVETGDVQLEASARADRGLALVRLGRTSEARLEMAKSLRLSRRQASPRRLAIALEYTGELHIASSDHRRASAALRRALAIANRIAPEGDIVPEVLRRQAEVALHASMLDDARRLAIEAATRAERLGDRYERATALRVQGQILRAQGKEPDCERALRDALTILGDLGETYERDRILQLLGVPEEEDAAEAVAAEAATPTSRSERRPAADTPDAQEIRRLLRKHGMIGSSRPLMDVMRQAYQLASLDLPVLITGETGTGKELLARAIHEMGRWSKGSLVAFNCATCPTELLDAELFGHTRGAYTGAVASRTGLVRSAEGGTLFLDEIGELRDESQARLLRFLDSGEIRPLGSDLVTQVNVRIIAATHVDLEERVRAGRFRRDLYFRLAGLRLQLPSVRDRHTDIRDLIKFFSAQARGTIRPNFAGLSERVICAMESASWPGNIRQIKTEVYRLAALSVDSVPVERWSSQEAGSIDPLLLDNEEATEILKDPARLTALLVEHGARVPEVAEILHISRGHLYRTMRRLKIRIADIQPSR